jgi:hypothetical protein
MSDEFDAARYLDAVAPAIGLPIAAAHRPGVVVNLARIEALARLVLDFPLDDTIEPAPVFTP